jgi:uncharacterized protein (TIGR03545 family)
MRWKYIIPRALLLAAIWAFFTFAFDPLLHRELISFGEEAVSAKVEIAGVATGFFPPRLSIAGARVANHNEPGTNLIEFDALELHLETGPLLRKSYIVDKGSITGLCWGTPREDSGLLPETPAQRDAREAAAKESAGQTNKTESEMLDHGKELLSGLLDRGKLELDPQQFESVRLGPELQKRWTAAFDDYQKRADRLKAEIESIEGRVKSNDGNKLERLEAYRSATSESAKLLQEIKQLKGEIDTHNRQARDDFAALKQAREHDLAKIRENADLFQIDPQQLTEFLLGPEVEHRLGEAVEWTKWLRARIAAAKEPQPVRQRGKEIVFPRHPETPKYLIKLLDVAGEHEMQGQTLTFEGTVTGITSNPVIYGEPVIVRLRGSGAADLNLKAVFDYTKPDVEPTHTVVFSYSADHPGALHLGDDHSLAVTVAAQALSCHAEIKLIGEELSGTLNLWQDPATLTAHIESPGGELGEHAASALEDIVSGIKAIEAFVGISGKLSSPRLSIKSNLGTQIAGGVSAAFEHQLDQGRDELAARLDAEAKKQSVQLQQLFKQKSQLLASRLNVTEQQVNDLAQQLTGGRLADLDKIARKPLDAVKKSLNGSKPLSSDDLKKEGESLKDDVKKLFRK